MIKLSKKIKIDLYDYDKQTKKARIIIPLKTIDYLKKFGLFLDSEFVESVIDMCFFKMQQRERNFLSSLFSCKFDKDMNLKNINSGLFTLEFCRKHDSFYIVDEFNNCKKGASVYVNTEGVELKPIPIKYEKINSEFEVITLGAK